VTSPTPLRLSMLSDRQKYPPGGLLGGGPGAAVSITLQDGTKPHPKSRSMLQPGDRLSLRFGGGGGYGAPANRNPEAVIADVREGYISAEAARTGYGLEDTVGLDAPKKEKA
jgi:N-methylhydantoinase B